ncbi:MAG: hypothetical protein E7553_00995 [Ruminococcaceae bacterium]|nr:hypothetical protein [Oscillospiraceae bacterium]
MKRCVRVVMTALLLMLVMSLSTAAMTVEEQMEQQLEASGAYDLLEELPGETRALLERLGVDRLSFDAAMAMQPQTVLSALGDLVRQESRAPLTAVMVLPGTVLLLGFFSSFHPLGGERSSIVRSVSVLAAVTPLLVPLWQTMQRTAAAADSASVFSLSFAPVYAGMLLASGHAATALSYQTVMVAAAQGIGVLISRVIVPLSFVTLAFGVTGAIDPARRLSGVGAAVGKINTWMLTVSLMLFVAMLSFQSILSAGADSVGGRMLRFSVAGFVPIVGGSLSEALYTVQGCLSSLRGTVGCFGVVSTVLIVLPTLIECVVWDMLLFAVKVTAELFSFGEIAGAADVLKGVMKTAIAVLASVGLLMIISLTLVTMGTGGAR